jgi:hypothetical protein
MIKRKNKDDIGNMISRAFQLKVVDNSSFSDHSSDDGRARSIEKHTPGLLKHEIHGLRPSSDP